MLSKTVKGLLFTCGVLAFSSTQILAQTVWINSADGLWRDVLNWSAGLPNPLMGITTIDNGGSKTILIDGPTLRENLVIQRITVQAPNGSTNTLLIQGISAPLLADGTININSGGRMVVENGSVEVDGTAGASFNLAGGELELRNGVLALTDAARGRVGVGAPGRLELVSGQVQASEDLLVGSLAGGNGRLEIRNGQLEVDGTLIVAHDIGSVGTMLIEGGTVLATNNTTTTRIGDDGNGQVTVAGGTLMMDDVSVGRSAGSTGLIEVAGGIVHSKDISLGRFANSSGKLVATSGQVSLPEDSLVIGREGAGIAEISGGTLTAWNVEIATNATSTGTLTISGGVVNISSNVVVGGGAAGNFNLTGGTTVVTNASGEGNVVVSNGNLLLDGGSLQVNQFFATNQSGTITFSAGVLKTGGTRIENGRRFVVGDGIRPATLHLEGGIHTFVGGLEISANATVTGCGTIVGEVIRNGTLALTCDEAPVLSNARIADGGISFDVPTRAGANYIVEFKESLGAAQWLALRTYPGTGSAITVTDTAVGQSRFYRVRVE